MADIRPFNSLRSLPQLVDKISSPPHDVFTFDEAKKITTKNPHSFLHITRSEVDLENENNPYSQRVYEKAKSTLYKFINEGYLINEPSASFYLYTQKWENGFQSGIIGVASVDDYLKGYIRKHEHTRIEKERDRLNHITACKAQTGVVFLAHKESLNLESFKQEYQTQNQPTYNFTSDDFINHKLWIINNDKNIQFIKNEFKKNSSLYIADGHHRSAAAAAYCLKKREELNQQHTGEEPFNFFLVGLFPFSQLHIFEYNRLIKDIGNLSTQDFMTQIEIHFTISKIYHKDLIQPKSAKEYSMFIDNTWYSITPKDHLMELTRDPLLKLDVTILQNYILSPILGISDPRNDPRLEYIGGHHHVDELELKVRESNAKVLFWLFPTTIEELVAVTDSHNVMPPKSTWFEPKIRDGLVAHLL